MNSFTFYSPTKIYFGKDSVSDIAKHISEFNPSKVLIVYGGGSIKKSGLLNKVETILDKAGIAHAEFGGAKPNPTLAHAYEGIKFAIENKTDFVLAIGGGSAIDTAKAIAHGTADPNIDIWDAFLGKIKIAKTLPIAVILTISAAGSESSDSAVLTNEETGQKRGLSTDFNRPKFSVLDPTLTYTLPDYQVSCGTTDIMMHTLDRYFNPLDNELTDAIAEALLRTVIKAGMTAHRNKEDYEAMSNLMWAGSLSHNDLTGLGGKKDFAVHQLGHELSAKFDLAHGASLSTMWGSWARYVYDAKPSRFARYARNVWGINEKDDVTAALSGIQATESYFKSIGMPICFSDGIGVQSDEIVREMADRCVRRGERTIGSFKVLNGDDVYKIYTAANR